MLKKVAKWVGIGLGVVVVLLLLALAGVYWMSNARLNKVYEVQVATVPVPSDEASLAEGERLYTFRGCIDCHGEDGAGKIFIDDPALGRVIASNLTAGQGGIGGSYTDADWVRAIRHGVRPDGLPLLVMPSQEFHGINDADLGAMIAYMKSLPPVDTNYPSHQLRLLGRTLLVAGVIPVLPAEEIDHQAARPSVVAAEVTVEYGAYLAQTCTGCHGATLSGGPIPGVPAEPPYPSNITLDEASGLGTWTEADFIKVFREGKRPDGSAIDPYMPWMALGKMTDAELSALWLYLQSVPPQAYGNR